MRKLKNSVGIPAILTFLVLFSGSRYVYAQDGISLGLGGAGTAYARGTEAIYWNPANLGFGQNGETPFELKLYSITGGIDNNSLTIDLYNTYNGKSWTDADKREILDAIPSEGLKIWGKTDVSVLSVAYRNFGFSVEGTGIGEGGIARDAFELALFGNASGDSVYSFSGEGNGFGVLSFNFSYGHPLYRNRKFLMPFGRVLNVRQLNIGANISLLRGLGYVDLIDSEGRLEILNNGINVPANFRTREAQGGWGAGVDIGVSMLTASNFSVGFVLDNAISSIRWSQNPHERVERFDLRRLKYLDEIHDLELDDYRESEYREIDSFSDGLPRNFRLGLAKHLTHGIVNAEMGRDNDRMRFSAGGGVFIRFLQLYGGIGVKEESAFFSAALAVNLRNFYFDVGVRQRGGVTGGSSKGITIANSIRLKF